MDYKKIFRSQKLRFAILKFLSFVPDTVMVRIQYKIKTGRWLNLSSPKRFTEKIQWYKCFYRNPILGQCVDKYAVREYVASKGLSDILNELYGVYDNADEIDFDKFPNKFVIKTTDGGGGENIIICKDKSKLNIDEVKEKLKSWQNKKNINAGREWAYTLIEKSRFIVEEFLENEEKPQSELPDYKFFCFNGEPYYCQLIQNRSTAETIDFYDMNWQHMPFYGLNPLHEPAAKPAAKPAAYEEMKEIVRKLSKGFPFVRVDLYHVKEGVFFGELTFYPASGYGNFTPDEWDAKLGDLMNISDKELQGGGKQLIINKQVQPKHGLIDYKFFCFNGKVSYIYGVSERNFDQPVKLGIYDNNFNKTDAQRNDERPQEVALPKPLNFDKMKSIAETLSKGFPHVRIDLYNLNGRIIFGEFTFYDGSGYMTYTPDSFDFTLGKQFILPKK